MNIKVGKAEANIPAWFAIFAAIVVDNMYANHCKKKMLAKAAEVSVEKPDK